ncbi:hypothetical protein ABZ636_33055 [Streptomyces sp. NPDC007251]|uniref:hypothetical protein n=1 Tax=Streptomyces sp. NPDC007251 TaxID=3154483 RepID=UPI0033F18D98
MARFTEFDYGITALTSRFHQDWTNTGSPRDVLRAYLWEGQDPRAVEILGRDAACAGEKMSDEHVETLWTASVDGGFAFPGSAESGTEWMRAIDAECRLWLSGKPSFGLSPVDVDPGSAQLTGVLEVIGSLGRYAVDDAVTSALASCARLCSPELALRFTLRVLSVSGVTIDRELHERISALGDSLGFGEFLVSDIADLVQ